MPPDASARRIVAVRDERCGRARAVHPRSVAHAPSGSRHPPPRLMSTARSAVTAIRVVLSAAPAHAFAAADPVTASSAIAPCAGEGTNVDSVEALREAVRPGESRSSPAHASRSASTSPASSLRRRVSTLPRIATGRSPGIQGGEEPGTPRAAGPHGCTGASDLEEAAARRHDAVARVGPSEVTARCSVPGRARKGGLARCAPRRRPGRPGGCARCRR